MAADIIRLELSLLGGLEVRRDGVPVTMLASRKTKALLAYLALSPRRHRRERLCEIFWERPDDPRGALRWSLSKLRAVVDDPLTKRLIADREHVALLADEFTTDVDKACSLLGDDPASEAVTAALTALQQPLLDGLDLPACPSFDSWLVAQRADVHRLRCQLLRRRATADTVAADQRLSWCREWLECDPFNVEAVTALARCLRELGQAEAAGQALLTFAAAIEGAGLTMPDSLPVDRLAAAAIDFVTRQEGIKRQRIRFCAAPDGVRIAYALVGTGPPLVKAANWLNHLELDWDAPIWAPMFQELARDHCFIRYDERGNGMSESSEADISFEAFIRDLETVVDAAGIDRFPLLGLSQGCAVAIEYAARHPERVSHLILWGGYAAGWRVTGDEAVKAEREAIITLVRSGWGRDDAVYRQMFSSTFLPSATPEELDWFNGFQRQTVSAGNAARFLEVFADIDVRDRLAGLDVPTLVMHARGDRRIPLQIGGQLATQIPGAEFLTLDSDNHLLLGREPASRQFVAHIRQFIA